jgi:3-dehydroquinate synthase
VFRPPELVWSSSLFYCWARFFKQLCLEGIVMSEELVFSFGSTQSHVFLQQKLPALTELPCWDEKKPCIAVCDRNTEAFLRSIIGPQAEPGGASRIFPLVLESGEEHKTWQSVEAILEKARSHGLGRDGLFLAVGGGVVCDLTAFAASVYMRGAALALIPTTLLAMADASLGGKTGFDFGGIKNLAGTFYPAETIIIALDTLQSLPARELKSGMAEIIKAAVLDPDTQTLELLTSLKPESPDNFVNNPAFEKLLLRALTIKGRIVEADPTETGGEPRSATSAAGSGKCVSGSSVSSERALLNLGHSFGHALESAAGLGKLSHGEAVAWGIARSCELGCVTGITPPERAESIQAMLSAWGYETAVTSFPVDGELFGEALLSDKKKKAGKLRFVVPNENSAELVEHNEKTALYLKQLMAEITR